jgi:O-antigen/teichoic acid export membrane protein
LSTLKSFFKDTVVYGIAAVLPRFINLALVAVFTSVLGKADFSDQTTWYVYAAFINVFLTMGIETAFFRYYASEQDKGKVISSAYTILLATSLLFFILGSLLAGFATESLGFKDPLFLKILVWITVLDTLAVIPFAYLRVTGRPIRFMMIKLTNITVLFIITFFLLLILPDLVPKFSDLFKIFGITSDYKPGVIHIIAANLVSSLITLLFLFPEMIKIKWSIDKTLIKKLLLYGWPIMVGGIAYAINENMDKLLIQRLIDKESNGVYAACYKLGVFMTLYITAFRMGAEPFFFNHAHTEDATKKYSIIMTWFVIFGCFSMLFVTAFIDLLAGLFIRNSIYLEGLFIVPVILLANLFSGIYNNLAIWYKLTDRTRFGMYISILGALLTILCLLIFVPILGIMGGAVATLFTYCSMAIISWYLGHKYYPVPYELKKIFLFIGITTLLSGLSFIYFRGNIIISCLTLGILGAVVYRIERKNLLSFIGK